MSIRLLLRPIFHSPLLRCTSTISAPAVPKRRTPPKNRNRPALPPLEESSLTETFIRGQGPGGQVINKSSICVSLVHSSGIRVVVQETRSREQNRKIARKLMQIKVRLKKSKIEGVLTQSGEQLDQVENPGTSRLDMQWARERAKKASRKRKGARSNEVDGGRVEKGVVAGSVDGSESVGVSSEGEEALDSAVEAGEEDDHEFEEDDFGDEFEETVDNEPRGGSIIP